MEETEIFRDNRIDKIIEIIKSYPDGVTTKQLQLELEKEGMIKSRLLIEKVLAYLLGKGKIRRITFNNMYVYKLKK